MPHRAQQQRHQHLRRPHQAEGPAPAIGRDQTATHGEAHKAPQRRPSVVEAHGGAQLLGLEVVAE